MTVPLGDGDGTATATPEPSTTTICGRSRRSSSSPTSRCPPELLAQLLEQPVADIERWCHELAAGYEPSGRGSSWCASPAATATRPTPT